MLCVKKVLLYIKGYVSVCLIVFNVSWERFETENLTNQLRYVCHLMDPLQTL